MWEIRTSVQDQHLSKTTLVSGFDENISIWGFWYIHAKAHGRYWVSSDTFIKNCQCIPSWATEGLTIQTPMWPVHFPVLFIIHNIISPSGMHSSKILPLSTIALFQRPFFCTSCEMVVALGPRGTAVIELHSNQRRNLIDFPTHSTLMLSSRHKIPH